MTLYEFIKLAPASWPQPDPRIIQNDDLGYDIDWDFGKGKVVGVTIQDDGDVIWAALVNGNSLHGTAVKPDIIPAALIDIFKQLGYEA